MSEHMLMMLVALGAELLILLLLLLTVSWFRNRAATRRDGKAIRALVARIKKGKAEREAVIERFLTEGMGMSGESLTRTKVGILRAQLVLLQRFAAIYQTRDAAAAAQLDADLAAALIAYHQLKAGPVAVKSDVAVIDATELRTLRAENERLAGELSMTMETMSRMLNEYTSIFSGAAPGTVAPIVAPAGVAAAADDDSLGITAATQTPGSESDDAAPVALQTSAADVCAEDADDDRIDLPGQGDSVPAADAGAESVVGGSENEMDLPAAVPASAEAGAGDAPGPAVAGQKPGTDAWPVAGIEVEEGDDLEAAVGVWEEGPVEVVGFDQPDDGEQPLRRQSGV